MPKLMAPFSAPMLATPTMIDAACRLGYIETQNAVVAVLRVEHELVRPAPPVKMSLPLPPKIKSSVELEPLSRLNSIVLTVVIGVESNSTHCSLRQADFDRVRCLE